VGFGVGSILLQIFLSKMESKWPGLILPIIAFLLSLTVVLSSAMFYEVQDTAEVISESGQIVSQPAGDASARPVPPVGERIVLIAIPFLLCNIPTAVYLVVYFGVRETRKRGKLLERMTAQDL
jgi:hypothetical protein